MRKTPYLISCAGSIALALSLLPFAWSDDKAPATARERGKAKAAPAAHWSYDDQADWTVLGDKNVQSPIQLSKAGGTAKLPGIYAEAKAVNVVNNGHSFQLNYDPERGGGIVQRDGRTFKLLQFHFHSPSEHTQESYLGWGGGEFPEHYAMEVHFVHSDGSANPSDEPATQRTDLCVVGVFIKEGKENPAIARVWENVDRENPDLTFNASDLMPKQGSYRTYNGSLTTPPCSSWVRWIVMDEPIEASAEQINQFREAMGGNTNRSIQKLFGRTPAPAGAN